MGQQARKLKEAVQTQPTPNLLDWPLPPEGWAINRRFIPRISSYFIVRPKDGTPDMVGIDLSFGGLMCISDAPLWPGNQMEFELLLPGEKEPIAACGRIVELVSYKENIGMRLRFENLPASQRKRIALWMSQQATEGV